MWLASPMAYISTRVVPANESQASRADSDVGEGKTANLYTVNDREAQLPQYKNHHHFPPGDGGCNTSRTHSVRTHCTTFKMPGVIQARTLYDKVFEDHIVNQQEDGTALIYIDRHL